MLFKIISLSLTKFLLEEAFKMYCYKQTDIDFNQ